MTDPTLTARRLERLRLSRQGVRRAAAVAAPPGSSASLRAGQLAAAVGGRVEQGPAGPVVVVESAGEVPLDHERLATLPYPIDLQRPLVCLDTETTGLGTAAGTLVFLVGLGSWDGQRFVVRQYLLPDHPDEPAFLDAVAAAIPDGAWLVTYNGRGFDWPLLVTRFRMQRRPPPLHAGHLDLLPVARQLWRHRLPDARLCSVEAGIAGVRREGDLPGALIPDRYFAWLRGGRGELLSDVIDHNRQDVVSLARLLAELGSRLGCDDGRRRAHPGDLAGLGRAFLRRRRNDEALACYEAAIERCRERLGEGWHAPAELDALLSQRARLLSRMGRAHESAAVWRTVADRGGALAARAWLQLAKHREHVERDPLAALEAVRRAQAYVEQAGLLGRPAMVPEGDIGPRIARLRRKAAARLSG